MKKTLIYVFVSMLFSIFLFSACSKENAERTGREAAENIKRPLDKARALHEKSAENVSRSDSLLNE